MIPLRHLVPLVLVASMTIATGAASPTTELAELDLASLHTEGPSLATGVAPAVVYRSMQDDDHVAFNLLVTGSTVHVEVDHAQGVYQAGVEADTTLWNESADYSQATLKLVTARPYFRIEAFQVAEQLLRVGHTGDCLDVALPANADVTASKFTHSPRAAPSVSSQGTIQTRLCPGTTSLEGDLLLVLWEVDIDVAGSQGSSRYHAGMGTGPAHSPDGESAPAQVSQSDQLYITIHNGTLALQREGGAGGAADAFLAGLQAQVQGTARAANARGHLTVAPGADALPSSLVFTGQLGLDIQPADRALHMLVAGGPGAVALNGVSLAMQSSASVRLDAPAWIAIAIAAGLIVTVVAIAWLIRRRTMEREPFLFHWARLLFGVRLYHLARLVVEVSVRKSPSADGFALKARILLDMGHYRDAITSASKAQVSLMHPLHLAANAMVASLACAKLPRSDATVEEAAQWFLAAKAADASRASNLDSDDDLLRASTDPVFQRALRGSESGDDLVRT